MRQFRRIQNKGSANIEIIGGLFMAIFVIAVVGLLCGWGMNICKFAGCDFEEPYKAEILRGVGILVGPLGGVIGWMNIDDTPKVKKIPSHSHNDDDSH